MPTYSDTQACTQLLGNLNQFLPLTMYTPAAENVKVAVVLTRAPMAPVLLLLLLPSKHDAPVIVSVQLMAQDS